MKNPIKSWIFLAVLCVGLLILGYTVAERQGTLIAFMMSFGLFLAVIFHGSESTLDVFQSVRVEGQDPWSLLSRIEHLSDLARIPTPRLYIMPTQTPTAFSVGRNWHNASIVISEGVLARFSDAEIEAVLAFEIAQIRQLDTLSFGVGRALAAALMTPAQAMDHFISLLIFRRHRPIAWFRSLVAPIAGLFVRLSVQSKCYYDADRFAGQLLKDQERVARTLWKLQSFARNTPVAAPPTFSHMFIINPLQARSWHRHFRIQPSIAQRIHRLVGRYPI